MFFSISSKQAAAIFTLLAATVHAHIILIEPRPYKFPQNDTQQSPLNTAGLDYPCKFPAGFVPERGEPTVLKLGKDANVMRWLGGATHGGGSCQISITPGFQPNNKSEWQVIKSMEGGCPSSAPGNLGGSANTPNPKTYTYTIPKDLEDIGDATISWTWFNRIGQREMYMNCAPVRIGGGRRGKRGVTKINRKRQSARPDIFRANIGNGCTTVDNKDVRFPNPGPELDDQTTDDRAAFPVGTCGAIIPRAGNGTAGAGAGTPASSRVAGAGTAASSTAAGAGTAASSRAAI